MNYRHSKLARCLSVLLSMLIMLTMMPTVAIAEENGDTQQVQQEQTEKAEPEPTPTPETTPMPEPTPTPEPEPAAEPESTSEPESADTSSDTDNNQAAEDNTDATADNAVEAGETAQPKAKAEEKKDAEKDEYPAQTLTANAGGVTVTLNAPEGALPKGANLNANQVGQKYIDAVEDTLEAQGRELTDAVAVDVTPVDKDGNEIQPRTSVSVTFSGTGLGLEAGDRVSVHRVSDDASSVTNMGGSGNANSATFSTNHFTIYVVGGSADPGQSAGDPYTVNYGSSVTLTSTHNRYNEGWSMSPSVQGVRFSSTATTATILNWNSTGEDKNLVVTHRYRNSRTGSIHTEEFYVVAKAQQKVKVTFWLKHADGSTEKKAESEVVPGTGVTPPTCEPKETYDSKDYGFDGWYTDETYATKANLDNVTATMEVYARYKELAKIYYEKNSGTDAVSNLPADIEAPIGETVHIDANAHRDGYTLTRWATNPDGTGTTFQPGSDITLESSMTLYAYWETGSIAIRYYNNRSASDTSVYRYKTGVPVNDTIRIYDEYPDRQGYLFLGWATSPTGTPSIKPDTDFNTGTDNIDLFAIWGEYKPEMLKYKELHAKGMTITYDGKTHTISDVTEMDSGRDYRKYGSSGMVRVSDWTQPSTVYHHIYADINNIEVSGKNAGHYSTPLYAQLYTHNDSTGNFDPLYMVIPIVDHELIINPVEIEVTTGSDSKEYDNTPLNGIGGSIKTPVETKNIDYSQDAGGATSVTVLGGSSPEKILIATTGTRTDLGVSVNDFAVHWESTETTADRHNYHFTGNLGTLTVYRNLRFDGNADGETVTDMPNPNPIKTTEDTVQIPDNVPRRGQYKFLGWAETENGDPKYNPGEKINLSSIKTSGDISLYAVWDAIQVMITYDSNGGTFRGSTNPVSIEYKYGDTIEIPEAPTRDGYEFLYWKGSEYYPGDEYLATEDHTFVAQWEKAGQKKKTSDNSDTKKKKKKSPETGDNTFMINWYMLMILAQILLFAALVFRTRRDRSE